MIVVRNLAILKKKGGINKRKLKMKAVMMIKKKKCREAKNYYNNSTFIITQSTIS